MKAKGLSISGWISRPDNYDGCKVEVYVGEKVTDDCILMMDPEISLSHAAIGGRYLTIRMQSQPNQEYTYFSL